MDCSCNEGKILELNGSGETSNELNAHNCLYVLGRNNLIPRAERIADEKAGRRWSHETDDAKWCREFHQAMNHLAVESGLVEK